MNTSNPSAPDEDTKSIVDSARRVVLERPAIKKRALRDVHAKHHGCVSAMFQADADLPEAFRVGVFAQKEPYPAWVRFSSSSSIPQSDTIPDGRGVAIKLLDVPSGSRLLTGDGAQTTTQDFVLLNGPAFFARNAADMVIAARLTADDKFPSLFFASPKMFAGLAATVTMTAAQADSPLDLTYFSQTPCKLGSDWLVKYRLRPELAVPRAVGASPNRATGNYLFEALRKRLQEKGSSEAPFVFRFEVQARKANDVPDAQIDDATFVWDDATYPFVPIARLTIPRQTFATTRRMEFAEKISFNPYNGLSEHEPMGSINRARKFVYQATAALRAKMNGTAENPVQYTRAEWDSLKDDPTGEAWTPEPYNPPGTGLLSLSGLLHLFPNAGRGVEAFLSSPKGFIVAPVLLAAFLLYGHCSPGGLVQPFTVPLASMMRSEDWIPPAIPSPSWTGASTATPSQDPVWAFRYAPVGAEAASGIPYWIFRALPRMFPARFKGGDWSAFGFDVDDDKEFYSDYHGLPRGFILSDTQFTAAGNQVAVTLKRVSLNCATCHRGEYIDDKGQPRFVDGMPSQRIDTAGFKEAVIESVQDPSFNANNVIAQINGLLAEEAAKRSADPNRPRAPSRLNWFERWTYKTIVEQMKIQSPPGLIRWMGPRPPNGPGRLDAFGALRFEFLFRGTEDVDKETLSTVDLPSIWHEGADWRPYHHWDGNTANVLARSYGAVVGIGGSPLSIRREGVEAVNDWLEKKLVAPAFPFANPGVDAIANGKALYTKDCASCHGTYTDETAPRLQRVTPCMTQAVDVGTDPFRARAFDPEFVKTLNAFGESASLWPRDAFRSTGGYICPPLDGIWARAPYLHNGSVPTLALLLGPAAERPPTFRRGSANYLPQEGGFAWTTDPPAQGSSFTFDTNRDGNRASGHSGVTPAGEIPVLVGADQRAVIAYLLTL